MGQTYNSNRIFFLSYNSSSFFHVDEQKASRDSCRHRTSARAKLTLLRNTTIRAESTILPFSMSGCEMKEGLQALENGTVLICLDDETTVLHKECVEKLFHGNGKQSSGNRWFDKSILIIISANSNTQV
jgi:hypothetical protein